MRLDNFKNLMRFEYVEKFDMKRLCMKFDEILQFQKFDEFQLLESLTICEIHSGSITCEI